MIRGLFPCWWWRLALVGVVYAVVFVAIWPARSVEALAGIEIEKRLLVSRADALAFLTDLGNGGRSLYLIQQGLDLFFILLYAGIVGSAVAMLGGRVNHRLLPPLLGLVILLVTADLIEDATLAVLVTSFPQPFEPALTTIGPNVTVKLVVAVLTLVSLLVLVAAALVRDRRRVLAGSGE